VGALYCLAAWELPQPAGDAGAAAQSGASGTVLRAQGDRAGGVTVSGGRGGGLIVGHYRTLFGRRGPFAKWPILTP